MLSYGTMPWDTQVLLDVHRQCWTCVYPTGNHSVHVNINHRHDARLISRDIRTAYPTLGEGVSEDTVEPLPPDSLKCRHHTQSARSQTHAHINLYKSTPAFRAPPYSILRTSTPISPNIMDTVVNEISYSC